MSNTKYYNKLVRDKIPIEIKEDNKMPFITKVKDEQLKLYLFRKIFEEVVEFEESESKEEFVDIMEVLLKMANFYGYDMKKIEKIRKQKAVRKGGFKENIVLKKVVENGTLWE